MLRRDPVDRHRGREWARGSFILAAYNHYYPPNNSSFDCSNPGRAKAITAARSFHPGGVNVLLCDGHVQFVKSSAAVATWRAVSTRARGKVFSDNDL